MKSKNDSEMSRVFKTVYEKLGKRGIKPKFHIMDNEVSSTDDIIIGEKVVF